MQSIKQERTDQVDTCKSKTGEQVTKETEMLFPTLSGPGTFLSRKERVGDGKGQLPRFSIPGPSLAHAETFFSTTMTYMCFLRS